MVKNILFTSNLHVRTLSLSLTLFQTYTRSTNKTKYISYLNVLVLKTVNPCNCFGLGINDLASNFQLGHVKSHLRLKYLALHRISTSNYMSFQRSSTGFSPVKYQPYQTSVKSSPYIYEFLTFKIVRSILST